MGFIFGECEFPSQEHTIETCKVFADYLDNGAKGDNFEGFKILFWLHGLNNGTGVFIAEADYTTKVFDHGAPFIKMGKCKIKVRQIMNDLEWVEAYKRNWSWYF